MGPSSGRRGRTVAVMGTDGRHVRSNGGMNACVVPRPISTSQLRSRIRQAQRQAENQIRQQVRQAQRNAESALNRWARDTQRKVDTAIAAENRRIDEDRRRVLNELQKSIRGRSSRVVYSPAEGRLVERVHHAVEELEGRECDVFLSYARVDGSEGAQQLKAALEERGVTVWFDEVSIVPGRSMSRQMDLGLQKARSGVAFLTPAYVAGRFWTERELGALLHKDTLIPVLHNVSFADVAQFSGILPDLAGLETSRDSIDTIAEKIWAAIAPQT